MSPAQRNAEAVRARQLAEAVRFYYSGRAWANKAASYRREIVVITDALIAAGAP